MKMLWMRRILLGLVAACSLYASIQNLLATRALGSISEDPVARWEKRFGPVRAELPFVRGAVGYISDADVPGAAFNDANDAGEYVLTQYALAPIVIIRGTGQEWNVANLSPESFRLWQGQHSGQFEILQLQGGLYLLHRIGG